MLEIAKGDIAGHSSVNKFGANGDIAKNTTEDIWDGGGDYPFPTTADITHIHQEADQVAMRGGVIEMQGLDADWNKITQTKALDASDTTTLVAIDTPMIRVFRARVLADVVIDSAVHVDDSTGLIIYATMAAGNNQTLMAIYTVAAGYTAYITKYYCTVIDATNKSPTSTRFGLWMADRANGYEFQVKHAVGIPQHGSMVEHQFLPYAGKITEKVDIKITALPLDENADVAAGFDLILVEND